MLISLKMLEYEINGERENEKYLSFSLNHHVLIRKDTIETNSKMFFMNENRKLKVI